MLVVLHTFGKDMKFNPHLHILLNYNFCFKYKFNKIWRSIILNNLNIRSNDYRYGYYVWSNKRFLKLNNITNYVGRYVRHPVIANNRIRNYTKKIVEFYYGDNNKNEIIVKKSINNFIHSLIQHIPPKNFKIVRYYNK